MKKITQIVAKEKTKISDKAKEYLRKHLKAELDKIFGTLTEDLAKQECDAEKLEADKVLFLRGNKCLTL